MPANFHESNFENVTVELDGNNYFDCTFTRCELVYRGGEPPAMVNCHVNDSGWLFRGRAGNTLKFLADMHHGGFAEIVDHIIKGITSGKVTEQPENKA